MLQRGEEDEESDKGTDESEVIFFKFRLSAFKVPSVLHILDMVLRKYKNQPLILEKLVLAVTLFKHLTGGLNSIPRRA